MTQAYFTKGGTHIGCLLIHRAALACQDYQNQERALREVRLVYLCFGLRVWQPKKT